MKKFGFIVKNDLGFSVSEAQLNSPINEILSKETTNANIPPALLNFSKKKLSLDIPKIGFLQKV
jgi:hypothetical protein